MLFNSLVFVAFLFIVLGLYYLAPPRAAKYVLLVSSYFFYGWWDWRFLSLLAASTVVDYTAGRVIAGSSSKRTRNATLTLSVVFNLGLLGTFKYFNFFAESLLSILHLIGFSADFGTLSIVLPVGISFYTFQTMSYTIDVWRREMPPERNFVVFASFVSFFPQLVAGPIERAKVLLPQLQGKSIATMEQFRSGSWLILWGYFLKVFMADNLAPVVDQIYAAHETVSGFDVLIAHYAFAYQILGDFAGYSFIAIGVARLFGVNLSENFRFPYFVKTPSAFWRNWHISLSSWLRDYLYISLGGNRGSSAFIHRNLMITMLLGGLWHGAAWNFVLWGFYHGAILVVFRFFSRSETGQSQAPESRLTGFVRIVFMFHLTCLGWMLFRTPDIATLGDMTGRLLGSFGSVDARTWYWLKQTIAFSAIPLFIMYLQFLRNNPQRIPFSTQWLEAVSYAVVIFGLAGMGNWGTRSFIYFQF